MKFSATTGWFYRDQDTAPADAVEVTAEQHAALLASQAQGKQIEPDENGFPIAVDPPAPTFDDLKAGKRGELDAACRAQIYAGFDCDALGAMYHYPANDKDQSNLAGSIIDSMLTSDPGYTTPFWCADANGVWAFRMHTPEQIQVVGQTAKTAILTALSHNETLQTLVSAAVDEADLDAIAW